MQHLFAQVLDLSARTLDWLSGYLFPLLPGTRLACGSSSRNCRSVGLDYHLVCTEMALPLVCPA
jgi:hypothetical protein